MSMLSSAEEIFDLCQYLAICQFIKGRETLC